MGSNLGEWLFDYGGIVGGESYASDFIWDARVIDDPSASSTMLGFGVLHNEDNCPNGSLKKSDATRLLNQLRLEAKKFKESNKALQDAIKNLKAEKLELRDEKLRLKAEKEQIEQMLKAIRIAPQFITEPSAATLHAASIAAYSKTIPYPNHLPADMWQWIPPAALDTSQDHVLRPPVA
ncbi:hypothetical protein C4D60_Mb10t04700 [Musa balbisiana]|uniref:Uncharacterized protein n=1 Tax=Musa balbisiana TaxID=52838 RepID=A0A4S8IUN0_MUSBA|nr:hypothetical protein C4D60_Mb10t04700 [Musa balbisiana]